MALALAACREDPEAGLDPAGRLMLDPLRERALEPEALIRRLELAPDATIADIGAGPGFLTLYFARAVPRGRVIATDVDAAYLEVAKRRARAARLENVEIRVVAADHPGLDAGSIDVAVLCQVDHFLKDRVSYLRALTTALRPRGRIVILNFNRHLDGAKSAAEEANLEIVDTWAPSISFTAIVLGPRYKEGE
jgi:ubiquinone/menaquinone biosynthesis C-methylase UbiE